MKLRPETFYRQIDSVWLSVIILREAQSVPETLMTEENDYIGRLMYIEIAK